MIDLEEVGGSVSFPQPPQSLASPRDAVGMKDEDLSPFACLKRGCAEPILTVERLEDYGTVRLRLVCVGGHSGYLPVEQPAPGRPVECKHPAPGICGECQQPLDQPQDGRHHRLFHPACGIIRKRRRERDSKREQRLA